MPTKIEESYPTWRMHQAVDKWSLNQLKLINNNIFLQIVDDAELEHQYSRYLCMQDIANEIIRHDYPGDIVEFGTFKGLGLLMLAQCFEHSRQNRCFIGIDSFQGLPESSGEWSQGMFDNTSYDECCKNMQNFMPVNTALSWKIISGWFNDVSVLENLNNSTSSISLVHFDADLGSSTTQALNLVKPYLQNRSDPMYFLFDDWGIDEKEIPLVWQSWVSENSQTLNFKFEEISHGLLSKNFKLTFN